jgi:hypothetical protein
MRAALAPQLLDLPRSGTLLAIFPSRPINFTSR